MCRQSDRLPGQVSRCGRRGGIAAGGAVAAVAGSMSALRQQAVQEDVLSYLYAIGGTGSSSATLACDCLAHQFGNAATTECASGAVRRTCRMPEEFHDRLRRRVRKTLGRDPEPSAGVIDSQSVEADAVVGSDSRGFSRMTSHGRRHPPGEAPYLTPDEPVTAGASGADPAVSRSLRT